MVARLGLSSPPPPVWFVWLRSLGLLGCVVMGLSKLWRWLCIVGRGGFLISTVAGVFLCLFLADAVVGLSL